MMLSHLARLAVSNMATSLPLTLRRSLLNRLVGNTRCYDLFQALGREFGVTELRIDGEYGLIEGSLGDDDILAAYARGVSLSRGSNAFFDTFFSRYRCGTYIDIGAHIGLNVIPLARHEFLACKAIEPDSTNFRFLKNNVRLNCPNGNVALFNVAPHDRPAHLQNGQGNGGALSGPVPKRTCVPVQGERLDDVLGYADLLEPIGIRFDVRGREALGLAGARGLIQRASIIVVKIWPSLKLGGNADISRWIELLAGDFAEGALEAGDGWPTPSWRPIQETKDLFAQLFLGRAEIPLAHFNLFLRKEPAGYLC